MSNQQAYGWCGGYRGGRSGNWQHSYAKHFRSVPVNIEEKADRFELQLFAPALNKEYIKIATKDDILTISYNNPDDDARTTKDGFTRREYRKNAFERSFMLKGKVDLDAISAVYADGILTVNLPKDPAANAPEKNIPVR